MKATAFEFRFRLPIILIIYLLGFTAPWNLALHLDGAGTNSHLWGVLATTLTRTTGIGIGVAFNVVLIAGILFGLAGALLRTWGTACLGPTVMRDSTMHGAEIAVHGPYSHVRNPLYIGTWLFTLLPALLMPASGAAFALVALVFFQLRLIFAEEAFLAAQPERLYRIYHDSVPRLLPSLRPRIATAGVKPHWGRALLAEIFMWGVILSFAVLGWRYNTLLLDQCVLVSLGVATIAGALTHKPQ